MKLQNAIQTKLTEGLAPVHLQVLNESGNHNVPKGSETHFRVRVVSAAFEGQSLVVRHRKIYALLAAELSGGVHALAIEALTPAEWKSSEKPGVSPPCEGGNGR